MSAGGCRATPSVCVGLLLSNLEVLKKWCIFRVWGQLGHHHQNFYTQRTEQKTSLGISTEGCRKVFVVQYRRVKEGPVSVQFEKLTNVGQSSNFGPAKSTMPDQNHHAVFFIFFYCFLFNSGLIDPACGWLYWGGHRSWLALLSAQPQQMQPSHCA